MTNPVTVQSTAPLVEQAIEGVFTLPLRVFEDERGRFMETFRREWFPWIDWTNMQGNRSDSKAGVIRGLHFHRKQVDYWYVPFGTMRAGLADLRPNSPTYRKTLTIDLGGGNDTALFIPIGVAHGFAALTDATLTYLVNQYYDGGDEFGVIWDDPDLSIPWGIESPILSGRDLKNPRWKDIPAEYFPK